MPDLFTHLAVARLPASFLRDPRLAVLVVLGTFMPDLTAKGLYWVLRSGDDFDLPSHTLAGVLLLSYTASLFLETRLRTRGFAALAAGGLLHVGVDILKANLGMGCSYFFYPLSLQAFELGVIDPIDITLLFPLDLALLAVAWAIERRLRRVRQ